MTLPLPRSLAGRMVLLLLVALIAAQTLTLSIFAYERHQLIEASVSDYMQDRSTALLNLLERSPPAWRERILRNSNRGRLHFSIYKDNPLPNLPQGALLRLQTQQLPAGFIASLQRRAERKDRQFEPNRAVAALNQKMADGTWLLTVRILHEPPRHPAQSSLLSLAIALLLAIIVVWISGRWITRPLAKLAAAAEGLGRGEEQPPLAETGPQDIRQTTRAFNQMRERLQRFVTDRTGMLAAISHDLRTPITALRLRAEFIDDLENREKILDILAEMQAMTEATLAFAKSEHSSEPTRAVDLSALLDALCEDYRAVGQQLEYSNTKRMVYRCRPLAIKRALRNLIDNALAYGSRVQIVLNQADDGIQISIRDAGPGIAEADLGRVFEPFVRLEESRNSDTGGIGLGLPIARTLIHAHGGELRLVNHVQSGLEAIIHLPSTPPDA